MPCSRGARLRDPFGLPSRSVRLFGCAKIPDPCLIRPHFPPKLNFSRSFSCSKDRMLSHV